MEDNITSQKKLIHDISQGADQEAQRIKTGAQKNREEQLSAAEVQIKNLEEEAERTIEEQLRSIRQQYASSLSVELRRLQLKARDQVIQTVVKRVKEKCESLVKKQEYSNVLLGWITEAAIGLNADSASVNASPPEKELITDSLLQKAMEKVMSFINKKTVLKLADSAPCVAQGIVLNAPDGRTSFNNQVPTRLLRYQSEIRRLIYNSLFSDEPEKSKE